MTKMNDDELKLYLQLVAKDMGWKLKPKPVKALTDEEYEKRYAKPIPLVQPKVDNYKGYRQRSYTESKARLPDTRTGQIPLRRGKYGMDVEEYLEWKYIESKKIKTKPPENTMVKVKKK